MTILDRLLLIAAVLCFLTSFGYTLYALGAGQFRPGRVNFIVILAGFLCQSAFLFLRGKAEGSCPLNNLFDVLIFQSWSLVLIYLIVGPASRLSLLGAFTTPLAMLLMLAAMILPINQSPTPRLFGNGWIEGHAALSLIAYGALGLSCISGTMYLTQESQLKGHKASSLLYNLPPINDLAAAIGRLMVLGFVLLTISFAAGFLSGMPVNTLKFGTSAVIWALYGGLIAMNRTLAPRRLAGGSIAVFAFAILSLPAIQYLSSRP